MAKLLRFECPACACTYLLPEGTLEDCPRCEEEIEETHRLRPQSELIEFRRKWAEDRKAKQ